MRLFVDAEFTDLKNPRLLSVAMVPQDGREFYAELTDPKTLRLASAFVEDVVLPQFGKHAATLCPTKAALGAAIGDYLAGFPGTVELVSDFETDLRLVVDAVRAARRWSALEPRCRLRDVGSQLSGIELESAWEEAFVQQELRSGSGLMRHHALLDARVLRDVCAQAGI